MKRLAILALVLAGCPAKKQRTLPVASAKPKPSPTASPVPEPVPEPAPDPEAQRIATALAGLMKARAPELAECQRIARAADYKVAGDVILSVKIGAQGKPDAITPEQNHGTPDGLLACATAAVMKWDLTEIGRPGDLVMLPLIFGGGKPQYTVSDADVPVFGPKNGNFAARVLIDALTTPDPKASMVRLSIKPRTRIPFHSRTSSAIFYTMHGQLKITLPGRSGTYVNPGEAAFVPAGQIHMLEALTGRTPGEFIVIFGPAGPEHSYRDPKDPAGTVVAQGTPPKSTVEVIKASSSSVKPLAIGGGKGQVRILFEQGGLGDGAISLEHFTAGPGMSVPEHVHEGSSELLYILEGEGSMTVGGQTLPVKPGLAVHIPAGVKHSFTVTQGPVTALQSYGPAGPEQRFKQPPPK